MQSLMISLSIPRPVRYLITSRFVSDFSGRSSFLAWWDELLDTFCGIADYSVVSQEVVSGTGFDYDAWMKPIAANPALETLYVSYPISWSVTFAIHLLCYLTIARKKLNSLPART